MTIRASTVSAKLIRKEYEGSLAITQIQQSLNSKYVSDVIVVFLTLDFSLLARILGASRKYSDLNPIEKKVKLHFSVLTIKTQKPKALRIFAPTLWLGTS